MLFWLVVCIVALFTCGFIARVVHDPVAEYCGTRQPSAYYFIGFLCLSLLIAIAVLVLCIAYKYLG